MPIASTTTLLKFDDHSTVELAGMDFAVAFNPQRPRSKLNNPLYQVRVNDMIDRVSIRKYIARA
ncbi:MULTISPECIES: hypothetical protein [unclassified Citrobacter]|uniref:hypothetical protein n=1 Tax=unclassified Citrobacter TaxID=2644389 RepID=UPI001901FB51|nr:MULTISPECIES: hypothetical protein [unclassified Citrobacter]MBJ8883414.1 hypothetical protein [Citrobacter sp. FDAARGOS_156]MDM2723468.1 hypothetical protein [Citrobacter sp. Cy230]HED2482274.1 hypothetical protein [Citrobacter youngae]